MFFQNVFIFIIVAPISGQSFIESVLRFFKEFSEHAAAEPDDTPQLLPEYDFIVVGGGTAGSVTANRLTEIHKWKVLLIEAGGFEKYIMDIPLFAEFLQLTHAKWDYKSVSSNSYCLGMEKHQCNFPRGKILGGSSVLNYMIYTRGNKQDYDNWAELGNTGWSFQEVLPYFKKVEDFTITKFYDPQYHSNKGNVTVSYTPYRTNIAKAAVRAEIQYGSKYTDYNGANQMGVSFTQASMNDGVRESSSRAYLHPIKNRVNFHLKTKSTVSKILINQNTMTAYGVQYVDSNVKTYVINATKEVILCAGSINSPQLLMLSGIGPKQNLEEIGVPVLKDSKVGYNLMDHIAVGGLTFLTNSSDAVTTERLIDPNNFINYFPRHKGLYTLAGGCEVISYHNTKNINRVNSGYPDVELLYFPASLSTTQLFGLVHNIDRDLYQEMFGPIKGQKSFTICPMLLRPKSRGRLYLRDKNYLSKAIIDPNYLSESEDIRTLVEGIKLVLNITQQPAMQFIGTDMYKKPIPNCEGQGFGTDDYWECMIRYFTFTIHHHSGTCKMGPESDKDAVVDPRLRVYGVNRLRVADASIIPVIPAAHTNAPTFMIAEKGADMIKEDWNRWDVAS